MSLSESLGDVYHRETKYVRPGGLGVTPVSVERPGKVVSLPAPTEDDGDGLWGVIKNRRSIRRFNQFQPLTLAELSQLLWATQGLTADPGDDRFRASPSAGALHPLDTYLVLNRVEGLPAGVALYDVPSREIKILSEGDFAEDIAMAALDQGMAADAAVVFVWVAVPGRSKPKYRDRAHRYIYMDAGHIGGQLHLAAVALGLGCCAIGAFLDDEVNAVVGVDGEQETAVYMSVVGHV